MIWDRFLIKNQLKLHARIRTGLCMNKKIFLQEYLYAVISGWDPLSLLVCVFRARPICWNTLGQKCWKTWNRSTTPHSPVTWSRAERDPRRGRARAPRAAAAWTSSRRPSRRRRSGRTTSRTRRTERVPKRPAKSHKSSPRVGVYREPPVAGNASERNGASETKASSTSRSRVHPSPVRVSPPRRRRSPGAGGCRRGRTSLQVFLQAQTFEY